jgi:hypothetical protein
MRTVLLSVLSTALLTATASGVRAKDDSRAVVQRAVRLLGGEAKLARALVAVKYSVEGTDHRRDDARFTGEFFVQMPDQARYSFTYPNGPIGTLVHGKNRDKGWIAIDGAAEERDEDGFQTVRKLQQADHVIELLPVLKDKAYTLAAQGESKVEDETVIGVKVSCKDLPDVLLYFDKAGGLLRKAEIRITKASGQETVYDEVYSDYRVVDPAAADERVLKQARLPADGASLLSLFRRHVLTEADRQTIRASIRRLGDVSFRIRKKAANDLVARGMAAVSYLRRAANDGDPEISRGAEQCLTRIEQNTGGTPVLAAAARLVAIRKPAGAAEVLLAYYPHAPDETVTREVAAALAEIGRGSQKPDKVLVQALADKDAVKRALARLAVGKDKGAYDHQPGRRLLISGVKRPMQGVIRHDGRKVMTWKITDVQFYNRLDDALFDKP